MGQFTEKQWPAVPKVAITANGGADGSIQVADTSNYYVGQTVAISTDGTNANSLQYKIRQVWSSTLIYVSLEDSSFESRANMTIYTSGVSTITAPKQPRRSGTAEEIAKYVYANEPAVANRSLLVDTQGNKIGSITDGAGVNRLAVDAALTIDTVTLDIDALNPATGGTPSNILVVGTTTGTEAGPRVPLAASTDGYIKNLQQNTLVTSPYDSIDATYPSATQTVYTYLQGGITGTTVATVTVNFVDSTQDQILNVSVVPTV